MITEGIERRNFGGLCVLLAIILAVITGPKLLNGEDDAESPLDEAELVRAFTSKVAPAVSTSFHAMSQAIHNGKSVEEARQVFEATLDVERDKAFTAICQDGKYLIDIEGGQSNEQ